MPITNRTSIWKPLWQIFCYRLDLSLIDATLWILFILIPLLPGLIVREFFNTLTGNPSLGLPLWGLIVLLLAVSLAQLACLFIARIVTTQYRFIMISLLRRNLLDHLLHRPGAEPLTTKGQTVSPGNAISYFRDDISQIEEYIAQFPDVIGDGLFTLVAIAILIRINAPMTLLVFLPLLAMIVVIRWVQARVKRHRRASRHATEQVTGIIGEIFSTVQAIKVASAESSILAYFRQLNQQRHQRMVQDQVLTAFLTSIFGNLVSLETGVILILAARSLQTHTLTVGDLSLFIYYFAYVTSFLTTIGHSMTLHQQTAVSFERLADLMASDKIHPSHPSTHPRIHSFPKSLTSHHPLYLKPLFAPTPSLPAITQPDRRDPALQELRVCNLTYLYPGTNQGIHNVNLAIARGRFVTITGPVGSGKTTLLRALLGLLPAQSGSIYWNDRLVEDPADFFVPPHCAYTPQIPQLFSHSLKANILLGLERSEAELIRAIEMAVFENDVAAMGHGLDTLIGVKGVRLSGGQLHRAAAARMVVRQPDLLVFDDLSSALDVETEQKLWTRLFSYHSHPVPKSKIQNPKSSSPTYLIVSHRPAVLERSDRIILLNNGRVEMEGTFDELPPRYVRDG